MVLRANGDIAHCFDEFVDGVTVSDELRKLLLMEDSDHYDVRTLSTEKSRVGRAMFHRARTCSSNSLRFTRCPHTRPTMLSSTTAAAAVVVAAAAAAVVAAEAVVVAAAAHIVVLKRSVWLCVVECVRARF